MKHHTLLATAALAALTLAASCRQASQTLDTPADSMAWALGQNIGHSLYGSPAVQGLDHDLVAEALRATLDGSAQRLPDDVEKRLVQQLISLNSEPPAANTGAQPPQPRADAPQPQPQAAGMSPQEADRMQTEYFARLEREKPGIRKHPAGFYYEALASGKGANALYGQRVSIDYRSFVMLTGEPYDQTYGRRDPIMTVVGDPMFTGLIQGLQLMNKGSKFRFYFPYQLAFGDGRNAHMPAYTPMIYEVELHEIYPD